MNHVLVWSRKFYEKEEVVDEDGVKMKRETCELNTTKPPWENLRSGEPSGIVYVPYGSKIFFVL